jgi:AraC-like DNA-binding protein
MSRARQRLTVEQEPFLVVRSFACTYPTGFVIDEHRHDWDQLLYASAGSMTVHARRATWLIPPGKAVFLPAEWEHGIRMWGDVAMRSLAFPRGIAAGECRVLSVTPLLRELILRVVEMAALDSRVATHQHLLGVLLEEMGQSAVAPLELPMPRDERALAVAQWVLAAADKDAGLDLLARRFAVGRRTLERLFRNETGMSFGLWRQKARMLESVRLLAEGKSVTDAALDTGYRSVSAFIAAFKQTFGCTPGRM